jgi:hypothetical protein
MSLDNQRVDTQYGCRDASGISVRSYKRRSMSMPDRVLVVEQIGNYSVAVVTSNRSTIASTVSFGVRAVVSSQRPNRGVRKRISSSIQADLYERRATLDRLLGWS